MGKIIGYIHSGITVKCLEDALRFYVDTLGLTCLATQVVNASYIFDIVTLSGLKEVKIAFIQIPDGSVIELLEYAGMDVQSGRSRSCDYGTGHLCLQVDHLAELYQELKEKGVKFQSNQIADITSGANKGAKAIYMLDPDGYIIELMEKTK
ncbi:VOC family protein [Sporolactobacillus sp. Y61]|uniref:VOC family protein n=1 Tax=Sporolactobacillus sp. Y61 TaxID=3160863 RepID=A0AAU8IF70_9BACL